MEEVNFTLEISGRERELPKARIAQFGSLNHIDIDLADAICDFIELKKSKKNSLDLLKHNENGEMHPFFSLDLSVVKNSRLTNFANQLKETDDTIYSFDISLAHQYSRLFLSLLPETFIGVKTSAIYPRKQITDMLKRFDDEYFPAMSAETYESFLNEVDGHIPPRRFRYHYNENELDQFIRNRNSHLSLNGEDWYSGLRQVEKETIIIRERMAYFYKNKNQLDYTTEYDCDGLNDIVVASIYQLLKTGGRFRRCQYCNRLFVSLDARETRCNRTSPRYPDKTCRAADDYDKKLKRNSSESEKKFNSIITSMYQRIKWAKTEDEEQQLRNECTEFRKQRRVWKSQINAGTRTESEYLQWLDDKSQKVRGR